MKIPYELWHYQKLECQMKLYNFKTCDSKVKQRYPGLISNHLIQGTILV